MPLAYHGFLYGYGGCLRRRAKNPTTLARLFCLLAKHASAFHMYEKTPSSGCFIRHVDPTGIEPVTSSMPWKRSTK